MTFIRGRAMGDCGTGKTLRGDIGVVLVLVLFYESLCVACLQSAIPRISTHSLCHVDPSEKGLKLHVQSMRCML